MPTTPTTGRTPARAPSDVSSTSSRATTSPAHEDCSFADLGIDSLALAELRADLQALLEEHGAGELAEEVNTRLLQRLTVAEFFRLMRQFGEGSGQPLDALRQALDQISAEYEAHEIAQMRADARLPLPELPPAPAGAASDILVTGVTGFLGPFLVSSLLGHTSYTIHALIRATDAEHGLDRIVASLRRAQLWSPGSGSRGPVAGARDLR